MWTPWTTRADLRARIAELEEPLEAALIVAKAEARSEAEESLRAEVRAHAQTKSLLAKCEENARTSDAALRTHYETLIRTMIEQNNAKRRPNAPR